MERMELTLEHLADLDEGKVQLMFAAELKRALLDCLNRPTEKKVRKVSLLVEIKPQCDQEGNCENVNIGFDVKASIPARRTKVYELGITNGGQAFFMVDADADVESE